MLKNEKKRRFFLIISKKRNKFVSIFKHINTNYKLIRTTNYLILYLNNMNELDRDLVFSEAVKAGKRIYYFDVKQSKNGERYVSITESKKIVEGSFENPRISFEKHKLFLYKEDYDKFFNALVNTLKVAKEGMENFPMHTSAEKPQSEPAQPVESPVETIADNAHVAEEIAPVVADEPVPEAKTQEDSFKIDLDF